MGKLKLIIFDCDGVMFDSLEANRQYYNHILDAFGHSPMDADELQYVHVHHVDDSIKHIYRNYPEDHHDADQYRLSLDYSPYLKYMKIEPDLVEFLKFLQPSYKTAISTNRSSTMSGILKDFNLEQYFEKVVCSLDVKNPKPHPEAMHMILDHFNMTANQAIYIGDSQVDRDHSTAVGMPLIAFKNPVLNAEYHVSSFMEITQLGIL